MRCWRWVAFWALVAIGSRCPNALKIDPAARTVRVPGATKEELEKLTSVEYAK